MQTASSSTPAASSRSRRTATPWSLIAAAFLMIYTFAVAGGLLSGQVPSERAWFLMAIPCIVPMGWYLAGYLRNRDKAHDDGEQDTGLLFSATGWGLVSAGLMFKYFAILAAQPDAYAAQATSPATPLCIGLGVLCLLIGAVVSWQAWLREDAE